MKVYQVLVPSFLAGAAVATLCVSIASSLPKPDTEPFRQVFVVPESCKTVIQIDQDVKANVRDDIMTGDTDRLIRGEDQWFNDKLSECLSYGKTN